MSFSGAADLAFGSYRLSVRDRTLSDADGPVPLPSRAFDVLLALIEERAAVMPKDELIRRVWGNLIVEDNNLHVQISTVRRALGSEGRCILTVPGRGYRFIGDLSAGPAEPRAFASPDDGGWDDGGWDAGAGRTNLPAQMTAMIGRRAELTAVCALFDSVRLVTLVGPGGVGKTKLALTAARVLARRFPMGCWLAELGAATDATSALTTIAGKLQLADFTGGSIEEDMAAALRWNDILLVLDGCEHLADTLGGKIATLLQRCPRLRILATSEMPLGIEGEIVRRIAPFDLPAAAEASSAETALRHDAVRLFAERAAAVDSRFEVTDGTAASVVEICRSLDGLPLAIELAAARAPLLGLEPLRARLADRLALLDDGRRDPGDRHHALRAAIAWSYGLLSEADRKLLRRLSVFSGGFTLAAALEVAAGPDFATWEVVKGVGALVQRSLITTGPDLVRPRHRMLQALRDFVLEQTETADDHPMMVRRHADYVLGLAESADEAWQDGGLREVLVRLSPEIDNLRAALNWSLGLDGDPALGARLAAATGRFWFASGLFTEGRGWIARALERAPANVEASTLARLKGLTTSGEGSELRHLTTPSEVHH